VITDGGKPGGGVIDHHQRFSIAMAKTANGNDPGLDRLLHEGFFEGLFGLGRP
jgi:hypothetical protein